MNNPWKVQIHESSGSDFEISVVHTERMGDHQKHWGWFDLENKLLISHNGTGRWPMSAIVWQELVDAAQRVADEMNRKEPVLVEQKRNIRS